MRRRSPLRYAPSVIAIALPSCSLSGLGDGVRPSDAGTDEGSPPADVAPPPEIFVTGQTDLRAVALNDERVVWATSDTLRACLKSACDAPTSLTSGEDLNGFIAVSRNAVAYALGPNSSGGGVRRCSLPDGANDVGTMYELGAVGDVAADGDETFLLHTGRDRVLHCDRYPGCGSSPTVVASGVEVGGRIALGAVHVYWTSGAPDNAVYRSPRSGTGGGAEVTAMARGQANPQAIAVDAESVYWANFDDGTVHACPLAGCGDGPRTIARDQGGPNAIATDGARVYWTNRTSSTVMACAIGGCQAPTVVARGIADPVSLAVDASHVYVASRGAGALYRVAK